MARKKEDIKYAPLNSDELDHLTTKLAKEKSIFIKAILMLSFLGFLIPTIAALIYFSIDQKIEEKQESYVVVPFTITYYYISLIVIFALIGIAAYVGYRFGYNKFQLDIRKKLKVIETVVIHKKHHVDINDSFFFFIHSKIRSSIEVSPEDFKYYQVGDEINIEYSLHAKEYFGYF